MLLAGSSAVQILKQKASEETYIYVVNDASRYICRISYQHVRSMI